MVRGAWCISISAGRLRAENTLCLCVPVHPVLSVLGRVNHFREKGWGWWVVGVGYE